MKEQPLNMRTNDDQTIVPANLDKEKGLLRSYRELTSALSYMISLYQEGKLTEGFKETLLETGENHLGDICKVFGFDGVLKKRKDEIFSEIRQRNEENRELRKQLGQKVSNEDLRERMKLLSDSVSNWWNIEGFGHITTTEQKFNGNGYYQCQLSGMLCEDYRTRGMKNSLDDKIKKLRDYGFEIDTEREKSIVDCDNNRKVLQKLLQSKYPSCEIVEYRSYAGRGKEKAEFRDIDIIIYNLDEIIIDKKPIEK